MLIKPDSSPSAKIVVVGVGGAGCNAVNTMISMDIQNVTFVAMNTDKQALDTNLAPNKILIGQETTKGLGGGGNWEVGKAAAEERKKAKFERKQQEERTRQFERQERERTQEREQSDKVEQEHK